MSTETIRELEALLQAAPADADRLFDAVERAEIELLDGLAEDPEPLRALADEALARAVELGHPLAAVTVASRIYFGRHDDRALRPSRWRSTPKTRRGPSTCSACSATRASAARWILAASLAHHRNAAEAGDPDAMFELYVFHSQGIAIPRDDAAAMEWCVRAAEAGSARAMANVGGFYATGHGVPRDEVEAIGWYYRAAEAGHGKAAATIGVMCALGQGTEASDEEARRWLGIAREIGFEPSRFVAECGLDPAKYLD